MNTNPLTITEHNSDPIKISAVQQNVAPLDSIIVSYGDTVKQSAVQAKRLSWIVDQIRSSAKLKNEISQVRSIDDPIKRQEYKRAHLPYFCFQRFADDRRKNRSFLQTQFVIIDLDHIQASLQDFRSRLDNDKDIFILFLSPSGDGLKVVFALTSPITSEDQYRATHRHFQQLLQSRYGIAPDTDDDPARACFLSYDPDIHVDPNCTLHNPHTPASTAPTQKNAKRPSQVPNALKGSASPGRTDSASTIIGHLIQRGVTEETALPLVHSWNREKNTPPLDDSKIEVMVKNEYERYKKQSSIQPLQVIEQDGCYYRTVNGEKTVTKKNITNFILRPKELLSLPDSDALTCSVLTSQGYQYDNVVIENTDWHTKSKLLKALGHQDCSFFGSDNDVQVLCSYINTQVPVRKQGTKVIGLVNDIWIAADSNITMSGLSSAVTIVPYQRGSDAFYHRIDYPNLDEQGYTALASGLYCNIGSINDHRTIMPMLGWFFASPLKPEIMSYKGAFPILFVHGAQGNGKSSTASVLMRLSGYKIPHPQKCDIKPFPLLKLLSSTNAIPIFLDEFKVSDMKDDSVNNLLRMMRMTYDGEMETKGRQDQTTESYELLAPLVVLGEWNINQPALKERIVFPRFSGAVKKDEKMQKAFETLRALPLEGFMTRYAQFCLNQKTKLLYDYSLKRVQMHFKGKNLTVAPRILHNLAVMRLGLSLFRSFGRSLNVKVPRFSIAEILDSQLSEITGSSNGAVKSAVDQLIEELGFMAQKNEKEVVVNSAYASVTTTPWFKQVTVEKVRCLAIRFNKIFPEFKEYAKRTKYEGDLLDKESYMKMFDECEYIVEKSHTVNIEGKGNRCVCIDVKKAKAAGLDLDGFGIK